jgi:hypothetical protein
MFLDGSGAKARDALHIIFAGEKVKTESLIPAPDVAESKATATARVLDLEALLRMKATAFRRKDHVHILDLMSVGLVDSSWLERLPPELRPRFQELLDNPDE